MFWKLNFNSLMLLIGLIIFTRLSFFIFLLEADFINDFGERVSALTAQTQGDINFYLKFSDDAWGHLSSLAKIYTFEELNIWVFQDFFPGPLFPWILSLTDYHRGSSFILSFLFTCLGILCSIIWSLNLRKMNATLLEQILVIFYPNLIYYAALISTDMLFCLFISSIYYILLIIKKRNLTNFLIALIMILLCVLTRPNSLVLFPVLGFYLWVSRKNFTKISFTFAYLSLFFLGLVSTIYYLPYFFAYKEASIHISYWGFTQQEYLNGVFDCLPKSINLFLSLILLGLSKLVYLTGLRPSYSGVEISIVVLRSIGGLLILPGIIYLFIRGNKIEKLFFILFCSPLLVGASQERYILPLSPILIFYGCRFFKEIRSTIFVIK